MFLHNYSTTLMLPKVKSMIYRQTSEIKTTPNCRRPSFDVVNLGFTCSPTLTVRVICSSYPSHDVIGLSRVTV